MCGKRTCQLFDAARLDGGGISLEQPQGVLDAAFQPSGKSVVTAGENGRAHFWSAPGGEPRDAPLPHQGRVMRVAYSPAGKFLATAQEGGLVRVWQLPPPAKTLSVSARPFSGRFRLALSNDGRLVLASPAWPGGGFPSIQVYDTASGAPIGVRLAASGRVNGADFSPDGSRVIAAVAPSRSGPGAIVIWDWRSAKQCFPAIPTPSEPADVSYSPRGDYAVAVCVKGDRSGRKDQAGVFAGVFGRRCRLSRGLRRPGGASRQSRFPISRSHWKGLPPAPPCLAGHRLDLRGDRRAR
jgi:WD40 repeat protein